MQQKFRLKKPPALQLYWRLLLYFMTALMAVLAIGCVVLEGEPEVVSYICYVLAACFMVPAGYYVALDIKSVVQLIKRGIRENPHTGRIVGDYRLKTVVFLVPGIISNVLFALFHAVLGVMAHSAWFGTLAAYYILLSLMRLHIIWQERSIAAAAPIQRMEKEVTVYYRSSVLFVLLAVVLGGMVVLLVASKGGRTYPDIAIYAVALYVFYKLILSVVHMVRVRKENSPLLTAARRVGHVDACVSLLILQTAMFSAFGTEQETLPAVMNGLTGTAVCLIILGIGIQGVYTARSMRRMLLGKETY